MRIRIDERRNHARFYRPMTFEKTYSLNFIPFDAFQLWNASNGKEA